ncbi:hypothetical protein R3I93_021670 [Phoxinus phoxinus]|uniref:Uncharacterized protein n=1 Tax=Phoxinus phoxinus TaxID=58324 RepID=A0AAN9GRG5_9TELE
MPHFDRRTAEDIHTRPLLGAALTHQQCVCSRSGEENTWQTPPGPHQWMTLLVWPGTADENQQEVRSVKEPLQQYPHPHLPENSSPAAGLKIEEEQNMSITDIRL